MDIDDLLDDFDGPTVADRQRERRQDELFEKVLEALGRPAPTPQVTLSPVIEVQPPAAEPVQPPPPKVTAWTFEFERNADGTIKRIHATPKE